MSIGDYGDETGEFIAVEEAKGSSAQRTATMPPGLLERLTDTAGSLVAGGGILLNVARAGVLSVASEIKMKFTNE